VQTGGTWSGARVSTELVDDFNQADDGVVERGESIGRDPLLAMARTPDRMDLIVLKEALSNAEASDAPTIASCGVGRVPITRDLDRVLLVQNGIEDRLGRQPWRECPSRRAGWLTKDCTRRQTALYEKSKTRPAAAVSRWPSRNAATARTSRRRNYPSCSGRRIAVEQGSRAVPNADSRMCVINGEQHQPRGLVHRSDCERRTAQAGFRCSGAVAAVGDSADHRLDRGLSLGSRDAAVRTEELSA